MKKQKKQKMNLLTELSLYGLILLLCAGIIMIAGYNLGTRLSDKIDVDNEVNCSILDKNICIDNTSQYYGCNIVRNVCYPPESLNNLSFYYKI